MKIFAVIDTNVIVSAMLRYNSIPGQVLQAVFSGKIVPLLNNDIVSEYTEVLARPKFHFRQDIVTDVINELEVQGIYLDAQHLDIELPDPKDAVFFEVVMEKRKSEDAYLVTGNIKHFPNVNYIVTPREILNILDNINNN